MAMVRLTCRAIALAAIAAPAVVGAQDLAKATDTFRNNAVRITTWFEGGANPTSGFGVVLREAGDTLYVVTARHVVTSRFDDPVREITVGFADRQKETTGRLIQEDDEWDVALLAVPKPRGFRWTFRWAIGIDTVGAQVGIIGRDGQWRPTGDVVAGQINAIRNGEIIADFTGAQPGVSGGPLLTSGGVIGMVYHDQGNVVYAYRIEDLKWLALERWLGIETLDPPDFPFAAFSIGPGFNIGIGGIQPDPFDFPPVSTSAVLEVALSPLFGIAIEAERGATQSARFQDLANERTYEYENRFRRLGAALILRSTRFRESAGYAGIGVSRLWLDPRLSIDNGEFVPLHDVPGAAAVPSDRAWAATFATGFDVVLPLDFFFGFDIRFSYTDTPYMNITIQDPFAEQTGRDWFAAFSWRVGYMIRPDRSRLRILRY